MNDAGEVSVQRKTAEALVTAFNDMNVEAIVSYRHPMCQRIFLPASMAIEPQDNAQYFSSLQKLRAVFHNFSLTVNDLLEDKDAGRICMWLGAKADTAAGEYINEYMWLLDFDADGKILTSKEFSDSVMERDFSPKLRAAVKKQLAEQSGGRADGK